MLFVLLTWTPFWAVNCGGPQNCLKVCQKQKSILDPPRFSEFFTALVVEQACRPRRCHTLGRILPKPQTWCDCQTPESNDWLTSRSFLICKNFKSSFSTFDSGIHDLAVSKNYVSICSIFCFVYYLNIMNYADAWVKKDEWLENKKCHLDPKSHFFFLIF